jgi:C4-dicarboxylate-specific signal transduction histidine kinase
MTESSSSPASDNLSVETLFGAYLMANKRTVEARLAQTISRQLEERIAARRAELAERDARLRAIGKSLREDVTLH